MVKFFSSGKKECAGEVTNKCRLGNIRETVWAGFWGVVWARFDALMVNPELWGLRCWAVFSSLCHLIVTVPTGVCNKRGPSSAKRIPSIVHGGAGDMDTQEW